MEEREAENRAIQQANEALDAMTDAVDNLGEYVIATGERANHGTNYRLNLLWIHAFAALLMAPAMFYTGKTGLTGPSFGFLRTLPGSPFSVAAILGIGGLILGLGAIFRAKRTEMVGLVMLAMFYLIMAVSFAVPIVRWFADSTPVKPPMYGPILYAHITLVMGFHIRGLIFAIRDERAIKNIGAGDHASR